MDQSKDVPDVPEEGAEPRGFARLSPEQRREMARRAGRIAHEKGRAHRFTAQEASLAGVKGGVAAHAKGVAHKFTRATAQAANAKSLQARRRNKAAQAREADHGHGEAGGHG